MVPRMAARGQSFMGAGEYYLHDRQASTSERVAFTHTENVPTKDPQKALKWMAFTAIHAEELKRQAGVPATGRPASKPVLTFSLAWHPEQKPEQWEMIVAGRQALSTLDLEDHEALMVSHTDRHHPHIHVICNLINPTTGKVNTLPYSKLKLSRWAEKYERENGKIYCEQRVENNEQRAKGVRVHTHAATVTDLYHASDSGRAFQAALSEQGFTLAQGRGTRILLIDRDGNLYNLARRIDGVKTDALKARLSDVDLKPLDEYSHLLNAKRKAAQQNQEPKSGEQKKQDRAELEYFDRDEQDRQWQESIIEAGISQRTRPTESPRRSAPKPTPAALLNALQDRHLAELGRFYTEHSQARLKLESSLDQAYGAHEQQLRDESGRLEGLLANAGMLRRGWLRFTGQIPKDADQEVQNLQLALGNIEWRRNEAYQALEVQTNEKRQILETKQHEERHQLQSELAANPQSPDEHASDAEASWEDPEANEDQGPTLGY